jgi:hypothetical protein
LGRNAGIFWTIFQFSNLFGSLIGFFVFKYLSSSLLFSVLLGIGVLGTLGLLLLPAYPVPPAALDESVPNPLHLQDDSNLINATEDTKAIEKETKHTECCSGISHDTMFLLLIRIGMTEILSLLKEKEIYFLFILFFWTGFELAFWTGSFPLLFDSKV